MRTSQKKLFIFSLLGILILITFVQFSKTSYYGIVDGIEQSSSLTRITLENQNTTLIIFENKINLEIGDKIKFQGKNETYQNHEQILVEKIWKVSQ